MQQDVKSLIQLKESELGQEGKREKAEESRVLRIDSHWEILHTHRTHLHFQVPVLVPGPLGNLS